MKTVKGSPIFNFYFIFALIVNIFFFYVKYDNNFIELLIVFGIADFIYYLTVIHGLHYFAYDEKLLVVKNSWNFLVSEEIKINQIEDIYLSGAYGGLYVIILVDGKKRKFGINNVGKDVLDEMINDIKSVMKNEDRLL